MRNEPGVTANDTLLAVTTLSFDIAGLELFLPLTVGARVIVVSREIAVDGSRLAETLERTGATVMQATPVTWRILLATGWKGNPQLKVLCGGEPLPLDLAQQLQPKVASLWNMYGPTETTIWSSAYRIQPDDDVMSVGRPIANTQIYLLDPLLQPVPIGVPGELYIGGTGLARGYLNRPELTAEKFVPHPFDDAPGARLYNTGDLARYRPDGTIEVLGRLDHQVKVRGYRIELGEIQAVLSQHPAVREGMVAVLDHNGDKRLAAYIVPQEGTALALDELRRHLGARLPDYMVPATFVLLQALPLTPNGKIDRKALPVPDATNTLREGVLTAASTPTEQRLVEMVCPLLGITEVGVNDNFFLMGGNSLMGAQLVARIGEEFGIELPLRLLFAAPTICQLATSVEELLLARAATGAGERMPVLVDGASSAATAFAAQEEVGRRERIVPVQPDGSKQPLFFLHGQWDGRYFFCYPVAQQLGVDQPFYALDPYRFDGLAALPAIEEVAAAHLKSLRAIQPEGPYLLAGWCNGALVAYEMARQLHADGQRIDLLLLMDPLPLVYPLRQRLYRTAFSHLGGLLGLSPERQLEWYLRLKHLVRRGRRFVWYRLYKRTQDPEHLTFEDLRQDYPRLFDWMALGYTPDTLYPGKITFFWADEGEEAHEFRKGWRHVEQGLTGNEVEIHRIPGDHITCRTEHLSVFGHTLETCVANAHAVAQHS
jgi:thioesterase domain-containing protein/acyl carrier protein